MDVYVLMELTGVRIDSEIFRGFCKPPQFLGEPPRLKDEPLRLGEHPRVQCGLKGSRVSLHGPRVNFKGSRASLHGFSVSLPGPRVSLNGTR